MRQQDKPLKRRLLECLVGLTVAVILFFLLIRNHEREESILKEHGVYTIAYVSEVTRHEKYRRYGGFETRYKIRFTYRLNGESFTVSQESTLFYPGMAGKRFFIQLAPGKTSTVRIVDNRSVPKSYTFEAPDEGWKKLPSFEEMNKAIKEAGEREANERIRKAFGYPDPE